MAEARDQTTTGSETQPVDVVEGPVGSSKLKEPSEVEGSVPPVDQDDVDVVIDDLPPTVGLEHASGPR